ncbi:MAG: hypothetical protein KAG61_00385 [Bacteriovoracaceae bacterium]|nr:hypothetical protein [Bacteriovoracaceae bacterium]
MNQFATSNQTDQQETTVTNGESGQVFFEFILLLLVMISLSYAMLYGVNGQIAERWTAMVHLVTKVGDSSPPKLN